MSKLTLETLDQERLRRSVDEQIFTKGQQLYMDGQVKLVEMKQEMASCIVQDKHPYRTEIKVARGYLYLKCNCSYAQRGIICEHDIAACLAVRGFLEQQLPPTWRNEINKIVNLPDNRKRKNPIQRYFLFFALYKNPYQETANWKIIPVQLSYSAWLRTTGEENLIPSPSQILDMLSKNKQLRYLFKTNFSSLDPQGCLNCPIEATLLANILVEKNRDYYAYTTRYSINDYLTQICLAKYPLFLNLPDDPSAIALSILDKPGKLKLTIDRDTSGISIYSKVDFGDFSVPINEQDSHNIYFYQVSPQWMLIHEYLFKLVDQDQVELIQLFAETPSILIPLKDEETFLRRDYLKLAQKFPIDGEMINWQEIREEPTKRIYLIETNGTISAELRFSYAGYEIQFDSQEREYSILQVGETWDLVKIYREHKFESLVFDELSSPAYGLKRPPKSERPGFLSLRARVHPVDFLIKGVNRLIQNGFEIFGEEQLKTARVNRNKPTISFQVSSGIDWFDINGVVNFGEIEVSLKEVRRMLRKKERFIKLSDGTIGEIPDEWLEKYRHLFSLGEETAIGLRMAPYHTAIIDQALAQADQATTDEQFLNYSKKFNDFTGLEPKTLPTGINGELRQYQKAGYDWLHFLHDYDFGGCLADDMGLGKTIQVLVFLQSIYIRQDRITKTDPIGLVDNREKIKASLIVVPRSLLINWQREANKFVPDLNMMIYSEANRPKEISIFDQYDLIITTYGIMLRDIIILQKYEFYYAILDESQAIKNPLSQTGRAARLLRSKHRLVITGTPVENSTVELWSQFAFINPGLLGSLDYFKKEFINSIEKKGDKDSLHTLRKIVHPFILRRTKDQVAPELPSRTEKILICDMSPAQQKLYNRTRDYYRGIVLGMLEKDGINPTRMKILEGLLRLRQISNHPQLIDEKYRGDSGKFELLLETIDTLRSEGHKALIFSQFVQMLRILRNTMGEKLIPYLYLDGHTRNRMELVDEFQNNPSIPFFLISLKAGGQGLNLTAADYVIHIDPWWNPAVESQASDRTHRIGQEKPVFIYKLITRDTVEEKIRILQDKKMKLVSQLITSESSFLKRLTPADIQDLFS